MLNLQIVHSSGFISLTGIQGEDNALLAYGGGPNAPSAVLQGADGDNALVFVSDYGVGIEIGGTGRNLIYGHGLADIMYAGVGSDLMIARDHDALMFGNVGPDWFDLNVHGFALIRDFNPAEDWIVIREKGPVHYDAVNGDIIWHHKVIGEMDPHLHHVKFVHEDPLIFG